MSFRVTSLRFILLATSVSVAVLAATAFGWTPKHGKFYYAHTWAGGTYHERVSFKVVGKKPRKLKKFVVRTACGQKILVPHALRVKRNRKFSFSGDANVKAGGTTFLTIKGKFVQGRKAEGNADPAACPQYKIDFVALLGGYTVGN